VTHPAKGCSILDEKMSRVVRASAECCSVNEALILSCCGRVSRNVGSINEALTYHVAM